MSKALLINCNLVQGTIYRLNSVADETDLNRYDYLIGMGSIAASEEDVTTPPEVPERISPEPMTGRPNSLTRAYS